MRRTSRSRIRRWTAADRPAVLYEWSRADVRTRRIIESQEGDVFGKSPTIPSPSDALPGRDARMPVPAAHFVNGHRLEEPFPAGLSRAVFGMGCFWGAERKFWELKGVY